MKRLIKKAIPKRLMPFAQRLHRRLFDDDTPQVDLSKEFASLDGIDALKCRISYNQYGGYCLPLSSHHRIAAQKILLNDVYEQKTIQFICSKCNDGDIVHAGTYFGDFLPAFSKAVDKRARIWAFEPNQENYRCTRITLALNDISNVVLTNAGLGDKQETLLIRTKDDYGRALGGASQIIADKSHDYAGTEPVQIVTIDDIVDSDRNVSIIQLDVEGHEKEALTGALETIRRCLPIIMVEVLANSTLLESEWFAENILSFGYRKTNDIDANSVFTCEPETGR